MKKMIAIMLAAVLVCALAACKKSPETDPSADVPSEPADPVTETTERVQEALTLKGLDPSTVLVAHFDGADGVARTAELLCAELGCADFAIVPAVPYPEDEAEKLARADREFSENILPALDGAAKNMSDYSVVITVYPEFNGNLPMILRTFLEDYDLRRTALLPVCVYDGAEAGSSFEQFADLLSGCPVYAGLAVGADDDAAGSISAWVNGEIG